MGSTPHAPAPWSDIASGAAVVRIAALWDARNRDAATSAVLWRESISCRAQALAGFEFEAVEDNMPQPDGLLFIQPEHWGQVRIGEVGYIEGAPDLVAEVSSSSASYDLGDKPKAYRRNGVREYVVWRVLDGRIDWFMHREERFEPLPPSPNGILRSTVFPGLWLDPAALVRGDVYGVFAIVQQGLSSHEHADFVARVEHARIA
jgi:Uma2 family endonuclease